MIPANVKFCKDCKFFADPKCHNDAAISSGSEYYVTGDLSKVEYYGAKAMRAGICGPEACHFQPKEPK